MKSYHMKTYRRKIAGFFAILLLFTTVLSQVIPKTTLAAIETNKVNLLDGVPFAAYGKPARRVMYHYTHNNGVNLRSAFCIQPANHMWDAALQERPYGINDGMPLIDSATQFMELALTMQWAGNWENSGKISNEKYIVAQGAMWSIMENVGVGSATFYNNMAVLKKPCH